MIIFDLEGILADDSHRRHFIDVKKNKDYQPVTITDFRVRNYEVDYSMPIGYTLWKHKQTRKDFQPDYRAYYDACEKDEPIYSTIDLLNFILIAARDITIWSSRCESVRRQTEYWLNNHVHPFAWNDSRLKVRPIGNTEPSHVLKERWLDEYIIDKAKKGRKFGENYIDFVFDSDEQSIQMWRRRGIFCFDCRQ